MKHAAFPLALALAACTAASPPVEGTPPPPAASPAPEASASEPAGPTRILNQDAAYRLRNNSGVTLQWIDWDRRGDARVTVGPDGVWRLSAAQSAPDGPGRVSVEGRVTEIGADYFLLDGRVTISDTPDVGRQCSDDRVWRFGVTQGRKYWRLREFEWCDSLTDYVDIYF
ncbi:hypothetical protein [Pelagerythrobacter sp.]|uniref:hypothetical protein n=1 Tax=Pelagerythrobacter sp. TaxID=2800702 RepID=UPI0035B155C9